MAEPPEHWRELDRSTPAGRLLYGLYGGDTSGRNVGNVYSNINRAKEAAKPRRLTAEAGMPLPPVPPTACWRRKSLPGCQLRGRQLLVCSAQTKASLAKRCVCCSAEPPGLAPPQKPAVKVPRVGCSPVRRSSSPPLRGRRSADIILAEIKANQEAALAATPPPPKGQAWSHVFVELQPWCLTCLLPAFGRTCAGFLQMLR